MDAKIFVPNDDHIVDEMRAIISFTKRTHSSSHKGYGPPHMAPTHCEREYSAKRAQNLIIKGDSIESKHLMQRGRGYKEWEKYK
jgi:hypothetical protein